MYQVWQFTKTESMSMMLKQMQRAFTISANLLDCPNSERLTGSTMHQQYSLIQNSYYKLGSFDM